MSDLRVPHRLTPDQARRIVVRAQLLDADRPGDVVEVAEQLGSVKIDPTATIAPCEQTVLWSRIGWSYEPGQLQKATEIDRQLFEYDGAFRPMSLLPLMLPAMRRISSPSSRASRSCSTAASGRPSAPCSPRASRAARRECSTSTGTRSPADSPRSCRGPRLASTRDASPHEGPGPPHHRARAAARRRPPRRRGGGRRAARLREDRPNGHDRTM